MNHIARKAGSIFLLCLPVMMGLTACSSSKNMSAGGNGTAAVTSAPPATPVPPAPSNEAHQSQPASLKNQHTNGLRTVAE